MAPDCKQPPYSDGYCLPHFRDATEATLDGKVPNPWAMAGVAPRCPNGHEPSRMQPWEEQASGGWSWFCTRCQKVTVKP